MRSRWGRSGLLWSLLPGLLVGCGGPRLIGEASREGEGPQLVAEGQLPPGDLLVISKVYVELEVRNVDGAQAEVERIARIHAGHLFRAMSWLAEGEQRATITFVVPAATREDTYRQ